MITDICRELTVYKEQYSLRILHILPYLICTITLQRSVLLFPLRDENSEVWELDCLAQGYIPNKWQSHGLELGSLALEPDP